MSAKKIVRVREVMRNNYFETDGLARVVDVLIKMRDENIEVVIVKKRDANDEYGILMLSDIAKKVLAKDKSPDRVNVYEIMSKPVLGLAPEMDVRYCARLFDKFGLNAAPVLENGLVIGLVSYRELVYKGILVESGEV